MRLIPILIAAITIQTATAVAQTPPDPPDMADIVSDFRAGAHEEARGKLKTLIDLQPTPNAKFRYGRMLIEGLGGPAVPEEGLGWMQEAMQEGHLGATSYVGRLYLTQGEKRNPEKAFQLFTKAAAGGDAEAKYYLGLMYASGDGVAKDSTIARNWYEGAARDGFGLAQYELSRWPGMPPEAAQEWQEQAARSGVAQAQFAVAQRLASDGGKIADILALYEQAAKAGHVPSQRALGTLYLTGTEGLEPDATLAETWLRQAVQGRDLVALLNLGLGLLNGNILAPNPKEAEDLLLLASDNGVHQASLALGRAYEAGAIRESDPVEAIAFFKLADQQGSRRAAQRLGRLALEDLSALNVAPHGAVRWVITLLEGESADQAMAWLTKQAKDGNRQAQSALGQWALAQGGKDERALEWLDAAARGGDLVAQFRLGEALSVGRFGDLDYVGAHSWLNIAASGGHAEAARMRDTLTDLMTADDIAEAQNRARDFFDASPPVGGIRLP